MKAPFLLRPIEAEPNSPEGGNTTVPFYEAMYLVHPSVDDERLEEVVARYNQVVESAGGVVEHSGKWDRRRLAYPINRVKEATYVLMYFRANPQVPAELDRLFRISDEVIRHLIVRHDKPHLVLTVSTVEEAVEAPAGEPATAEQPIEVTEPAETEAVGEESTEQADVFESEEPASAEEEQA
ncbi:MAG: 30S ribosomal protein S6 [Armatimonadota bacterium]|nr:30S ribosomal protein S6 [bacterium]MDW8320853.1 30S ribosomal protein S6 [Armatimonadota bacterium]